MVDLTKPIGKCTAQELAAAILLNAGPGRFNPQQVLTDLYAHRHLWRTFLMGLPIPVCTDVHLPPTILLPLRDLEDHWNLDTLYLLTRGDECVEPLETLGETWGCEVIVYDRHQSGWLVGHLPDYAPILAFWWD